MSPADLAPGNDQIYEEEQENFLTPGNPQDGQVILYKVGTAKPQRASSQRGLQYCGPLM